MCAGRISQARGHWQRKQILDNIYEKECWIGFRTFLDCSSHTQYIHINVYTASYLVKMMCSCQQYFIKYTLLFMSIMAKALVTLCGVVMHWILIDIHSKQRMDSTPTLLITLHFWLRYKCLVNYEVSGNIIQIFQGHLRMNHFVDPMIPHQAPSSC